MRTLLLHPYVFSVGRDAVPRVPDISLARSSDRKQTLGKPGRGGSTVAGTGSRSPHGDKWDVRSASLPSPIDMDAVQRIPTTLNRYLHLMEEKEKSRISMQPCAALPLVSPSQIPRGRLTATSTTALFFAILSAGRMPRHCAPG